MTFSIRKTKFGFLVGYNVTEFLNFKMIPIKHLNSINETTHLILSMCNIMHSKNTKVNQENVHNVFKNLLNENMNRF